MEEEYDIVPATEGDRERIAEFLRQHFFKDEPLHIALEAPPNRPTESLKIINSLKDGVSLMAITKSGLLIGVALSGMKRKDSGPRVPRAASLQAFHPSYTKLGNFVDKVEENSNLWEVSGAETSFYLHILGVHSLARGKGVGRKLVESSIEVAKSKGLPVLWIMCTSHYTAKICRSLSMQPVFKLAYKDNKNEEGVPEFLPPPPHTEVVFFIQKIQR